MPSFIMIFLWNLVANSLSAEFIEAMVLKYDQWLAYTAQPNCDNCVLPPDKGIMHDHNIDYCICIYMTLYI